MKKTLGIDFGTKRIGLALSYGSLAEPLAIINGENQDDAIVEIIKIIKTENVEQIVLGLSENEMARQTKKFGHKLKAAITPIPLFYHDETLSSYQVGELMKNRSLAQRKKPRDDKAAALILGDWLIEKK